MTSDAIEIAAKHGIKLHRLRVGVWYAALPYTGEYGFTDLDALRALRRRPTIMDVDAACIDAAIAEAAALAEVPE